MGKVVGKKLHLPAFAWQALARQHSMLTSAWLLDRCRRLITSISNAFLNFATGNIAAEQLEFGGSARAMVGTGK